VMQPALRCGGPAAGSLTMEGMPLPERFSLARILKSYFLNFALSVCPNVDFKDCQ
jgi:hypothetical protein